MKSWPMISNKWSKLIKSLHQKKYRKTEQLFLVEGAKAVLELLASDWPVSALFATEAFLEQHAALCQKATLVQRCDSSELEKVGTFATNDSALAVVPIPHYQWQTPAPSEWILVLDNINDPGNLGTIIRIADWFGIQHILCSEDTADAFNPKVIAAAKGSFLRVQLHYCALATVLRNAERPVYGAFLGGESVHDLPLTTAGGYVVLGNEANGISAAVSQYISRRITIPAFGAAESLNVGIASAIICDNLSRLSRQNNEISK